MSLAKVRDQEVAVRLVRNAIRKNRIPNGMLLYGPAGVGKRLTAFETAKAVMCLSSDRFSLGDACDECLICRRVEHGTHPDIKVTIPVGKSRIINVETVEEINEMAGLTPYEAAWRVFIILDAERMGIPAQNHLLKTLEEPRGNSLFLLVTEQPGALLPTIRSRCQRLRFGALSPATVTELLLRDRDLSPEVAQSIAALSQGQMSRALDLVESEKREIVLDIVKELASGSDPLEQAESFAEHLNTRRRQIELALKAEMANDDQSATTKENLDEAKREMAAAAEAAVRKDIIEYLYLFQTWYRDAMVLQSSHAEASLLNRDQTAVLAAYVASRGDRLDVPAKLKAVEKCRIHLERFISEERALRDLFFVLSN